MSILTIEGQVEAVLLTDAPHRLAAANYASSLAKASLAAAPQLLQHASSV